MMWKRLRGQECVTIALTLMLLVHFLESGQGWAKAREKIAKQSINAAKVVKVFDGDTLEVITDTKSPSNKGNKLRIRFLGIDAPEKNQDKGDYCKNLLSQKVEKDSLVDVEIFGKDRYSRVIGKIFVRENKSLNPKRVDVGYWLITQGCAWHYVKYAKDQPSQDRSLYAEAQAKAEKDRIGIWESLKQGQRPMTPESFRRRR